MSAAPEKYLVWRTSSSEFQGPLDGLRSLPVISVGCDRRLLALREQVIKGTGLQVRSVTPDEAEELAHSSDSQVWLFCSTVEPGSLLYLASAVRRYSPESRLVLLEGPFPMGHEAMLFHRVLASPRSIDLLVETLRELSGGWEKKRSIGVRGTASSRG